jgi:hypothetical protein
MRSMLVKIIWIIGGVAGLAAAGAWARFIWNRDWGTSMRGHALWFWVMALPAWIIFFVVFFAVFLVVSRIWEALFQEKFPL